MGEKIDTDKQLLKDIFLGCVDVQKTSEEIDKQGIDYVVTLKDGAEVYIDVKTREKGASRYWKNNEPELAIECWSVCPAINSKGRPGWTFSQKSVVDYILYTFDISDSKLNYLFPFQLLRIASQKNYYLWRTTYKCARQSSYDWDSEAVFVPVSVVINAINNVMKGAETHDEQV